MLTNCTFDGIVYDVQRVMRECLAIKPDLVFLWDEAWFAFARFHPVYRPRTAMRAARSLIEKLRLPAYRQEYARYAEQLAEERPTDDALLDRELLPDPARARVRVYATQSTHKTLTSLRQGSMIHVYDQDFSQKAEDTFHEAYMAHTSTSPNYQILASLDLGRRQAALEGFELVQKQVENAMRLRDAIDYHPLLSKYGRPDPAGVSAERCRSAAAIGADQDGPGLETGRVRPRPLPHHLVYRAHRRRWRHVQA
jgi:arginine decarboxylase